MRRLPLVLPAPRPHANAAATAVRVARAVAPPALGPARVHARDVTTFTRRTIGNPRSGRVPVRPRATFIRPLSSQNTTTTTGQPDTQTAAPAAEEEQPAETTASSDAETSSAAEQAEQQERGEEVLRRLVPFHFETGVALFAKRPPRPFPPPFLSPPSGSFSDPLSTHDRSRDRRKAYVNGRIIKGFTNGDDAVFASRWFVCANDGVGAWSTRPRGHAGLWARLILHYWATAIFEDAARQGDEYKPDPVGNLQKAYELTVEATSKPNDWQGTTTAAGAQLYYKKGEEGMKPLLYVTNVGDSQVMVVRPATKEMVYKSTEQWHWFDCPRQLGTNSPDTPATRAVVDEVAIQEGDIVLAMSDGVIDNLWSHEIVAKVCDSLERWKAGEVSGRKAALLAEEGDSGMGFVAEELMEAAKVIAMDPFAESPFMEHAIEEGLASGGGKMDDISVVAALCRRNDD